MSARTRESSGADGLDLALALVGALIASALVPTTAPAYVDPSVVTYTIQAIAGVAVALGAVLGVALRRTRRIIFRIFRIDENAKKVRDPEVHRFEADGTSETEAAPTSTIGVVPSPLGSAAMLAEADDRARRVREDLARGRAARRLSWPRRFVRSLLGCSFLVATVFVFAPLEIVAGSSESLAFGFFDVTTLIIAVGVAIALGLSLVVSLFRGRAFDVILTIVVALGLCCYVQALFMNASLPLADGQALDLSRHVTVTVISTGVWAAVFAVLLVLNAKRTATCRAFVLCVSALLLTVQAVSMAEVAQAEAAEAPPDRGALVVGDYGINEVGAEGDVTVFVLDMFDTRTLDEAVADDPAVFDQYTGFTWFRNSTGSLIPTAYAIPFLLSGEWPTVDEPYEAYLDRRYDESTLLSDIRDQGYEITTYSDSITVPRMEPYAANIRHENDRTIDESTLWPVFARMVLYRDAPWILKPLFWFYTDELNGTAMDSYVMDDVKYAKTLRTEGLTVSENADRTFRFIHLMGDHWPYTMDREGERVPEKDGSQLEQAEGALLVVADYLKELKRLGLHDQSTVIVTADHGEWYLTQEPLDRPSTPILLVKPAETPEEAARPLQVSEVPTGHLDLAATIVDAVGGDASAYGPTVFEVGEGPRDRDYWMTLQSDTRATAWRRYVIQGDVLDMDDWHITDDVIVVPPKD